jgi:DNA polymerase-3 subunit chi
MGAAFFYHLTRHPVDVTLSMLLRKAQGAGWRVVVRATDLGRLNWLDEKLWSGQELDFLPHGLAGGAHDADQPILLTNLAEAANNPQCVICVDGADISADEISNLERVCILFDGNNFEELERARKQWKTLKDAGASAQYWSQADGNWEKKAEI